MADRRSDKNDGRTPGIAACGAVDRAFGDTASATSEDTASATSEDTSSATSVRTADYLIVGNSAAGVTAAEYIRANDDAASIVMLSLEPYPAYGRPLISYMIEGKTDEEKIWFKPPDFYERNRIETLFGSNYEAVKLDAENHRMQLADGSSVVYKKCLLAMGSVPFTPPIQGLQGKSNVFTFMTLDDAKAASAAAASAQRAARSCGRESRVIVIGAGLIGLKAAEALSHHVDEVVVLELAPRILPAVLDADGASLLQDMLERRHIVCLPGTSAEEILGEGDQATGVVLTDGTQLDCDLVIAAVGVRPNCSLAVEAGASQGRGLVCDEHLKTSLPDVYAAGDVVQVLDALDATLRPLALWPNAMRQGRCVGQQMASAPDAEPFIDNFAVNAVDFFDISLLTAGIINPSEDSSCTVKLIRCQDSYAKFVMRDGRLVGYILLNRPANAGIYTAMIENGLALDVFDEGIFDDAPLNLDFPEDLRWSRLHRFYPSGLDTYGRKRGG